MKALDILEIASKYLNLREELDCFFNEDSQDTPTTEKTNIFNNLLDALNMAIKEIAIEYKPLSFEDNKFEFSNLTKDAYKIGEIRDSDRRYKFNLIDGYIVIDGNGPKTIKYLFIPEDVESTDDIDCFNSLYEKVLALGVCKEYYYLNNIFDEAAIWEEKYNKSLENCLRGLGSHSLPERRWL